uniref:Uncharacterized protein n=1 Tax=Candidatus Kentrum sp. MB TaxID=2138164 RepID=A0A451BCK7_9GAMM|nr:MAG: hypothetical protein BECKMB1821G_GA0114241_1001100 [Candidatus Kentron sp. MB]VFK32619.1 MAG: hypothetical protein BECKMB1821I_GA0114274_103520 [Candidatus Kentron sp. MB]VFK76000.1 MAG: hypothetical protein BECKMB1821H_GA0114242_103819 [Candidatus Kentron sp. MB]
MGTRALIKIDFQGESRGLVHYRGIDGYPDAVIPTLLGIVLPKTPLSALSGPQLLSLQDKLDEFAERVEPGEIDEVLCDYIYSITVEASGLQLYCQGGKEQPKLVYAEVYRSMDGAIWTKRASPGFDSW